MKRKNIIVKSIIVLTLILSVTFGALSSFSYFGDQGNTQMNLATAFLNTKINARIDDSISVIETGDFIVKTIEIHQYNDGNIGVSSESNIDLAWDDGFSVDGIYLYDSSISDSDIRSDVLNNGASNALSVLKNNNTVTYKMNRLELKKNTDEVQKIKVVISNKHTSTLNIDLTSAIKETSGYGFSEDLKAHLFIECA